MALDLDVQSLKLALHTEGARWVANVTPLSHLSDAQKLTRLGAVPPDGMAGLAAREAKPALHFAARVAMAGATGAAAAAASYAPGWDWRNAWGGNYVTPIKDQSSCGSCVAFGTVATVESMVRITHHDPNYSVDLSEAQLFYCYARSEGRLCEGPNGGWWPDHALNHFQSTGVADEACYPYTPGDQNCAHLCPDWKARVTLVTGNHSISDAPSMKSWLSTKGPLITCFSVYDDFFSYSSGVYQHHSGSLAGGHCVCVIGYNDVGQYWICKNSWGGGWGENGFFCIGYGQCGIDSQMWAVDGVTLSKTILTDTAIAGPALANINDTQIAIAWTGTDSAHHLNVMSSSDGGQTFGGKVILGETSFDGPGFAFGNGRAYLAWVGTDSAHHLNVVSSADCHNFVNKVTLGDTSRFGPALAFGNGVVYIAWVGTDSGWRLNVMSSTDGMHWGNKVTLNESSDSSPGLCFANGKLYLLWQGTDSNSSLNIVESTDGKNFGNKITMGDSSDFRPTMAAKGNELVLGWTGRDSQHHLNTMTSTGGTHAFGSKLVYGDTSVAGEFLLTFKGAVYVAWTGTDSQHRLNVMKLGV